MQIYNTLSAEGLCMTSISVDSLQKQNIEMKTQIEELKQVVVELVKVVVPESSWKTDQNAKQTRKTSDVEARNIQTKQVFMKFISEAEYNQ